MNSIERAQKRKSIQSRLTKLEAERNELFDEQLRITVAVSNADEKIGRLSDELKSLEEKGPTTVTEHAMIQFLQRSGMVDFRAVADVILSEKTKTMIEKMGNGKFPIEGHKLRAVVKDNTVITVI